MHDLQEVQALLARWARWAAMRADSGLGFARITQLGRIIEQGPAAAAIRTTHGQRPTPAAAVEEAVEQAIGLLPDDLRRVILAVYLAPGSTKQKAHDLNVSATRYFDNQKHAHYFLAGALAAAGVYRAR